MNLSLAYKEAATNIMWSVVGVTEFSVILKGNNPAVCKYVPNNEFSLMTMTGKLVSI